MQAAMYYGPGDVRIERTADPRPGPGEVVVKIDRALTCGTDLKTYRRGHPTIIKAVPSLFGHEFAGTVAEVGAGVDPGRWPVGTRVVAANSAPCNRCFSCRIGRQSLCDNLEFLNGAYAEAIAVPARIVAQNLHPIPDGLSSAAAALTEPLACAVHGIAESGIAVGDTVAVNGAGPIGLMFVRLAALSGARVVCCDLSADRLAVARELGAVETVVIADGVDQVAAVRGLTPDGRGVDVAIEAVGLPEVWEATVRMARKGGTVNLFGGAKGGTSFSVSTTLLHYSELTIKGVFHHTPRHVETALGLLRDGVVPAAPFLSGERPLADLVPTLEAIGRQEGIKYAIVPPSA
jgi:L-iditol 2-dehydrogenase